MLGASWESGFAEKVLGVEIVQELENEMTVSQQCTLMAQGQQYPGQVEGSDHASLLCTGEAASGVPCPGLGSSVQE